MVAKALLPVFGGAPAVWLVAMVFFQAVLLVGYGYGHFIGKLAPRLQTPVHLLLFTLGWASIPDQVRWFTSTGNPSISVLGSLALTIGPAYALISPNSPLLQRWYALTGKGKHGRPYFLYSASNIGSLFGLLTYPFLIEPRWTLTEQFQNFKLGYMVVGLGLACAAILLVKSATVSENKTEETNDTLPPTRRDKLTWMLYAGAPSALMLGVTANLTSNIAPIPLLWVIPLSFYLLTYTLGFSEKLKVTSQQLSRLLPIFATPLLLPIILESSSPLVEIASFHLVVFFLAAWMCHRRLAEIAPESKFATSFYFYLALGGVIGSSIVSLVFPLITNSYIEYPLALALICGLRIRSTEGKNDWRDLAYPLGVFALGVICSLAIVPALHLQGTAKTAASMGLPAIIAFLLSERPIAYGLAMAAVFLSARVSHVGIEGKILASERSFFGVHRVTADKNFHQLSHGNTIHGIQNLDKPTVPMTYYHPTGPIGQVFISYAGDIQRVGLIGLGVGSLAAYWSPGMEMTFFEIDPKVNDIAKNPNWFTFLSNSQADIKVVIGDGRAELERTSGTYDLIVIDAFSSDSIPSHLMTTEALKLYLSRLSPKGIVAYHISNRYLSLKEVLAAETAELGAKLRYFDDYVLDEQDEKDGKTPSQWLLISGSDANFEELSSNPGWEKTVDTRGARPWTDSYSNLFEAIIRKQKEEQF